MDKLRESGENYLETILILEKRNGIARSVDVANELNFSKPSISRAMSVLKQAGYVTVGNINQLLLTPEGRKIAESVYERHCILHEFLVSIGVDDETASNDACRIEHVISEETFACIKKELKKIEDEKNKKSYFFVFELVSKNFYFLMKYKFYN